MNKKMRFLIATGAIAMTAVCFGITSADIDSTIPSVSDVSTTTLEAASVTITLSGQSNDGGAVTFSATTSPQSGTLGAISGNSVTYTPNAGFTGTDSFQYIAIEGATSSPAATATISITAPPAAPDTATVRIFSGTTLIASSSIALADASAPDVSFTADDASSHTVPARSAIAVVESLDATTSSFDISDLEYFNGLGFFVQCITTPSGGTQACGNYPSFWHFDVNGQESTVGMSSYVVQNGDDITLVLTGNPGRQVTLSASSIPSGTPFTATEEAYDPVSGTYATTTGFVIGVGTLNPDFSFTELATSTVDQNGQAIFTLNATGTFQVGLQADSYSSTANITVTDAPAQQQGSSGGGGGGGGISHPQFNMSLALSYLASKQNADGSLGSNDSSLITDWTAIALASEGQSAAQAKLRNYLLTAIPVMTSASDYERHAMALEALGINPYSGTPVNYIAPIAAAFDGTQIGIPSEDNDDIFALFALLHAGYATNDPIIQKEAAFIISKQNADGSWDESADLTAAAIQALGQLFGAPGIDPAALGQSLGQASGYLAGAQQQNGGWGAVDSTSWVQTMINAVNQEDPAHASTWASSLGFFPMDAIAQAQAQQSDGAVQPASASTDTRVCSTSYAIVAASGKSWLSILQSFSQPVGISGGNGVGGGTSTTANSSETSTAATATSTPAVATSTPDTIATSTPPIIVATTTATSTHPIVKVKKVAVKKLAPPPAPQTTTTYAQPVAQQTAAQTAAAASASSDNLLGNLWHAVTSFFAWIF